MIPDRTQIMESLKIALEVLRAHRLRSALVMLGVGVAVTTLMGMVAILSGLSSKIEQDITGGDTVVLHVSKFDFVGGDHRAQFNRKDLTTEDARALARLDHVAAVDVTYRQNRALRHGNLKARLITLFGTTTYFPAINNLAVRQGRFFSAYEVDHRRPVVVMGARPARELFPNEDPVGKYLRLENKEYQVVGVFAEDESIFARLFGSLAQNFVVIPHTAYERDFRFRREPLFIQMIIAGKDNITRVQEDARALLRARRKVMPGQPDDFAMNTSDAALEFVQKLTGPIGLALVVMSSIGLMVGGIGVMVIMLVSVTERTREIGIRKALGATRREIIWQFLIEAGLLTCLGGLIGILCGLGLAFLISRLGDLPFVLPIFWVLLAVIVSVGTGIVFGLYPANRAARLDPIEALRYEV